MNIRTGAVASLLMALGAPSFGIPLLDLPLGQPTNLNSLTFSPNSVFGEGGTTAGTVSLNAPAPPGGATVTLSSNSGVLTFPGTVTVVEGTSSADFQLTAGHVSQTYVRYVTASLNGVNRSAAVSIHPGLAVVGANPNNLTGGSPASGSVTLAGNAPPGGVTVTLDDNSGSIITPAETFVSEGTKTAYFSISTTQVATTSTRLLFATLNGVTKAEYLTLTNGPRISTFTITPSSVKGGTGADALIVLTGPTPAHGRNVQVSDNSSALTTPTEFFIGPGFTQRGFSVLTKPVNATYTRQVTVSMGGTARTASLTLTP